MALRGIWRTELYILRSRAVARIGRLPALFYRAFRNPKSWHEPGCAFQLPGEQVRSGARGAAQERYNF